MSFSDWEAHLAKREEKVERREEIRTRAPGLLSGRFATQ